MDYKNMRLKVITITVIICVGVLALGIAELFYYNNTAACAISLILFLILGFGGLKDIDHINTLEDLNDFNELIEDLMDYMNQPDTYYKKRGHSDC